MANDALGGTSVAAHAASLAAKEYLQTGARLGAEDAIAAMTAHVARAA